MKQLIKEFNEMKLDPIFEIEVNEEYYIYYIQADEKGLSGGGCCNVGFMPYKDLFVPWDDYFGLDEHLQELYDLCFNNATIENEKEGA
jgi:hypothetical protein